MGFKVFFKRYNFLVLALLPMLSLAMVSIATALFVIGSIILYKKNDNQNFFGDNKKYFRILFWYSLPFPLLILSLIWTEDLKNGISILEKGLSFVIIPGTIFFLRPINSKNQIRIFIQTYIISSTVYGIIMLAYIFCQSIPSDLLLISNYQSTIKLRSLFDKIPLLNEHPIYFTLLTGTALLLLYYNKFKQEWINIIITIILLAGILLASSRGPILALFLVFIVILYTNIKNKLKALAVIAIFLLSSVFIVYLTPLKSRLDEITNTKNLYPEGIHHNSFNLRMGIYKCSFQLMKTTPIMGFGGDVQHALDQCYIESFNTDAYQITSYNSHNQYFHFWLSFGVLGFILILCSYIIYIQKAVLFKDQEYGMFLLFFFVAFLTENILSRNTGIVLFTLFNSLLFYKNLVAHDSD
ncbi:O-antigen ligase family protein [Arenibacter amylolyticus]|uniref:O-antigen ligase family protein n=1 Tax=Arenibacter amylolyticus TaxID=1406873 RepID=UPI000A37AA70|nr:O-antigen ligase family protein [Arenibacter amylolyticus]